jgi:DNA uptake protein ComE-like DNA-binding protein
VALWLIVALTAVALAVTAGARTRRYHAAAFEAGVQARWIERGALQSALRALRETEGRRPDETQLPCSGEVVGGGAFWIIRAPLTDEQERSFGLIDEGGKIDLNTASAELLERLPNMTPEVAAAVVDWRDPDETESPGGAESAYYLRGDDPYNAKNSRFETLQELRLVAGVDDALLYGEDTNRNGVLDAWENDGQTTPPDDDHDGQLDRGLAGRTTPFLRWPQQQAGSTVQVNSASRQQIRQALAQVLPAARADELALLIVRRRPFASIFHLYYACGLTREELVAIEPLATVQTDDAFRLNVNAAASAVLQCLPGIEEADAQALLTARAAQPPRDSVAWMIDAGIGQEKLLAAAAAGVAGRSYQYTADILAVAANGRAFRRARYVIDASGDSPRVVHRQDLTHLGWPLDAAILDRLRVGEPLEDVLADVKE